MPMSRPSSGQPRGRVRRGPSCRIGHRLVGDPRRRVRTRRGRRPMGQPGRDRRRVPVRPMGHRVTADRSLWLNPVWTPPRPFGDGAVASDADRVTPSASAARSGPVCVAGPVVAEPSPLRVLPVGRIRGTVAEQLPPGLARDHSQAGPGDRIRSHDDRSARPTTPRRIGANATNLRDHADLPFGTALDSTRGVGHPGHGELGCERPSRRERGRAGVAGA